MNASLRAFFAARGVLEVETPILSIAGTVDPNIESFGTADGRWLQTSPEFAMKRLLAAGSGPIFQIAHVFRIDESGRHHNPEFSMLEWYRPGWDHHALMDELAELLSTLSGRTKKKVPRVSYRDAFLAHAGIDPFASTTIELAGRCRAAGLDLVPPAGSTEVMARDFYLDLLMSAQVGPSLGRQGSEFLFDFPASQAALARVRPDTPPVAERFELFWNGIELANGFHELSDPDEQRRRFKADWQRRRAAGRPAPAIDEHLLDALRSGLPNCAGVAVGLDRLLMELLGLDDVRDTLAFDWERA